eukprot:CAMPEP_0115071186 /NCGR_PEP_ID=MMETSP0227-20121206/13530_1 /TAXON_ID=89957 /ORGANISM="Polarella glacialis, Strain CCMP 1383" /LENGTH=81 /DNA_ID=CAMNT_0002457785 /DNA_START=656 /DNA_END=898 /DNA_ORIENTATION=-
MASDPLQLHLRVCIDATSFFQESLHFRQTVQPSGGTGFDDATGALPLRLVGRSTRILCCPRVRGQKHNPQEGSQVPSKHSK